MTAALLVYRNSTPEVMAWAEDIRARERKVLEDRLVWMRAIYDAAGVPDPEPYDKNVRSAWIRNGGAFIGMSWPRELDDQLPEHWFRPVKDDHLVRPRATGAGKKIIAEMRRFDRPDARRELEQKFGMHGVTFAGTGLYSCGVHYEDDSVWVTWASADVAEEKWAQNVGDHGWVRVPLVEYIGRFGEDVMK